MPYRRTEEGWRMIRRIGLGIVGSLTSSFVSLLANFFVLAWVAKNFDVGSASLFLMLLSGSRVFGVMGSYGMGRLTLRYVASNPVHFARELIVRSLVITLIFSALIIGFACTALYFSVAGNFGFSTHDLTFICFWFLGSSLCSVLSDGFRGLHKNNCAAMYGTALPLVLVVLSLSLYVDTAMTSLIEVYALSYLFVAILSAFHLISMTPDKRTNGIGQGFPFVARGFVILLSSILLIFMTEGHLWILRYIGNDREVVDYSLGIKVVGVMTVLAPLFAGVTQSTLAQLLKSGQKEKAVFIVRSIAILNNIVSGSICLLLLLFAEPILFYLYDYSSWTMLVGVKLVAILQIANFFTGFPGAVLMMSGYERTVLYSVTFAILFGVFTNVLTYSYWGGLSAYIGYGVTILTHTLFLWAFSMRRLNINTIALWPDVLTLIRQTRVYVKSHRFDNPFFRVAEEVAAKLRDLVQR